MKKVILIGASGSGKTTLMQAISNSMQEYKKTQTIECLENIFDTPGEYIENRRFFNALLCTSFECDIIALVQASCDNRCIFPPGFSTMFNKSVIGIVTKMDLKDKQLEFAEECLRNTGVDRIYRISALTRDGIDELKAFLDC
ncbi:MAG: EutP/PduV family microcompartment system protein [Pseudomonadota bacterium]